MLLSFLATEVADQVSAEAAEDCKATDLPALVHPAFGRGDTSYLIELMTRSRHLKRLEVRVRWRHVSAVFGSS